MLTSQEADAYYDPYDITESSRNISGMSSPTSYRGAGSPSMSPYRLVPPISSAEKDVSDVTSCLRSATLSAIPH